MKYSSKKQQLFKEFEDVVSIGALLRPTLVKAIGDLRLSELETLRSTLIEAEKRLANSRLSFRERFSSAQEVLVKTFAFAPIWRFIAGRIEDSWRMAEGLTVRELSVVSLLFGMLLEETERQIQTKGKKKTG